MRFHTFEWDDTNVAHIARHAVEPHEVEGVCRGPTLILRGREGRYLVYGCAANGRLLLIVLRSVGGGRVRAITARDMTDRERRLYQRRH